MTDALAWLNLIPLWASAGLLLRISVQMATVKAVSDIHERRITLLEERALPPSLRAVR